eukprot:6587485-Pyramimonas_sp.AAC.1
MALTNTRGSPTSDCSRIAMPRESGDALRALRAACVTSAVVAAGASGKPRERPCACGRRRSADACSHAQRPHAH